jgi:hypothetical protein
VLFNRAHGENHAKFIVKPMCQNASEAIMAIVVNIMGPLERPEACKFQKSMDSIRLHSTLSATTSTLQFSPIIDNFRAIIFVAISIITFELYPGLISSPIITS